MLRVVGLQKDESADKEFVLLQNQGHMRLTLRGHLLLSEAALQGSALSETGFAFSEDESIAPGLFVMLSTGVGTPIWAKTRDGAFVYHTYMGRNESFWNQCPGPLHVMHPHHTYVDRASRTEYLTLR